MSRNIKITPLMATVAREFFESGNYILIKFNASASVHKNFAKYHATFPRDVAWSLLVIKDFIFSKSFPNRLRELDDIYIYRNISDKSEYIIMNITQLDYTGDISTTETYYRIKKY